MDKLGINLLNHPENTALFLCEQSNQKLCIVKYKDLQKQVLKISLFIENEDVPSRSTIGICSDKSYSLIALTLGILEANFSFCYLVKHEIENNNLDDYNVRYFFSDSQINQPDVELTKTVTICERIVYFYKSKSSKEVKQFKNAGNDLNNICYTILTSGTTGSKKLVRVTYSSIIPNLVGMQTIFKLTPTDVILSSAPISFDVFILDILLAFRSSATLMMISDDLRFDAFVFEHVTFLQMTPTNFLQYGIENIKTKIMHANSKLK